MTGRLKRDQGELFYEFRLGDVIPEDHLVRRIDAALDLTCVYTKNLNTGVAVMKSAQDGA
jgi:hypothetical protein